MDWGDLGGKLIRLGAPVIGTALGGPLGGTIGGVIGNVVASAIGAEPTPEAVNEVLDRQDPAVLQNQLSSADQIVQSKMSALVEIAKAEAEIQKTNIVQVNETVRAELGKVSWWHWRHLIGYAVLGWLGGPLPIVLYQMSVGQVDVMNATIQGLVSLTPIIGIAAGLNGFVARDTTLQKQVAATGEKPPSVANKIIEAIAPVKRR